MKTLRGQRRGPGSPPAVRLASAHSVLQTARRGRPGLHAPSAPISCPGSRLCCLARGHSSRAPTPSRVLREDREPPRPHTRVPRHTHRLRGTAGHGRFHTPVFAAEACAHTHGTHAAPVSVHAAPAGAWAPARRPVCHHEATPEPPPPPRLAAGPGSAIPAFPRPFQAAEAFTTLPACLPSGARTLCLGSSPAFQKDREHARLCTGPAELGASSSPSFLKGQLGSPLEQGAGGLDRGQPASLLPPPAPWLLVPQHGGVPAEMKRAKAGDWKAPMGLGGARPSWQTTGRGAGRMGPSVSRLSRNPNWGEPRRPSRHPAPTRLLPGARSE